MFGYVIANLEGLTQAQKDRYKAATAACAGCSSSGTAFPAA